MDARFMTIEARKSAMRSALLSLGGAMALLGISVAATGCIEDSDCGICDPDNLVLESISGINYAGRKINVLNPECVGDDCPGSVSEGSYFIQDIGPCEETEEALESPRGPEEYCKISPLVSTFGIEFVFNNLLDPTSIELVRKRPDNPQLFEVYDWKSQVLEVQGPITRYNGDYRKGTGDRPDQMTRMVNLACVDNLRDANIPFGHEDYENPATNPCNTVAGGQPLKMRTAESDGSAPKFKSYRGIWGSYGNSCDTPEEGPDTCCSRCDYLLGTQVAKYGLLPDGNRSLSEGEARPLFRTPHIEDVGAGGAITCDATAGDPYIECAAFVPWVNRAEEETSYRYRFCDPTDPACVEADYSMPYYDQLRELHPSQRPAGLERKSAKCVSTAQCRSSEGHDLPGTSCVGVTPDGQACAPERTEDCAEAACVGEWFVGCATNPDTTGEQGYCVDKRFSTRGAGACLQSGAGFRALCDEDNTTNCQMAPANTKLAFCDNDEDGSLFADECCQGSLQAGMSLADPAVCDPYFQNLTPITRYERNKNLPESTRDCVCKSEADAGCEEVVAAGCFDADGNLRPDRAGQYAVKFVTRAGGVIYDPAVKGFEWRPADLGGVPRAAIEGCAEGRGLIDDRNVEDGWRAHDAFLGESFEDFDRAMCSGQQYRVAFSPPGDGVEFVEDKVGNTLEGKTDYLFETPSFHVVPGSGFPTDNLRIGACDEFSIRLSNKYDMSPENVAKLQIWRIAESGVTDPSNFLEMVAGGVNCSADEAELDATGLPPCLTVDIENQDSGQIAVQVDPAEFGPVLTTGLTYRLVVPGLNNPGEMNDAAAYGAAFWDACGMPLILGETNEADFLYDFTIDPPKCKEDEDADNVQLSCDNAPDFFNPDQGDGDRDGVGDVIDLCPTVPTSTANSADSDKDGVGNECDNCRQTVNQYNEDDANPPDYMLVRNIPYQADSDGDGIGDVCDNCVLTANCEDYDAANPWSPGDPIAFDDFNRCQQDNDSNMVGDACAPTGPDDFDPAVAAGVVGIGPDDDFDQDGIANADDACPRQPLGDRITCTTSDDCPGNRKCETTYGVCDHLDTDQDDIGDICDSCAFAQNPMQNVDGFAQEDDDDNDFVGRMCETNAQCEARADARPFGFFPVAANGNCCTVAMLESPDTGNLIDAITGLEISDPDGLPVRIVCSQAEQDAMACRKLPSSVADRPGVLTPPPGCEDALVDAFGSADATLNTRLDIDSPEIAGDANALWGQLCFLPQFDQDYDGLGDLCDLCKFDFDPQNLPFIDANGKVWPKDGKYCNGEYSVENKCGGMEPTGGSDGGSGDSGGSDGGSGGSGGGSGGSGG
jgi:hypothetical protein